MNHREGCATFVATRVALLLSTALLVVAAAGCSDAAGNGGGPSESATSGVAIQDMDGKTIDVTLDLWSQSRGQPSIFLAASYRAFELAVRELYSEGEVPLRGEMEVQYFHPHKAVQHALELVATPECITCEGNSLQHLTIESFSYVFTRIDTNLTLEARMVEGMVPDRFGELRYMVNGYDKDWHDDEPSMEEREEFASLYEDVLNRLMETPTEELYRGSKTAAGVEHSQSFEDKSA